MRKPLFPSAATLAATAAFAVLGVMPASAQMQAPMQGPMHRHAQPDAADAMLMDAMPMEMHAHGGMGGSPEMRARRMAVFKDKLGISAAQEVAWTAWTQAMQPPARMSAAEREALLKLPTPERIDRMQALGERMRAQGAQRAEATKRFYAALNPDQQKLFDEMTARRMARGMHMMRGGPRGGDHKHG